MSWLPEERFSGLQMEKLCDRVHDLGQNDAHFCRAPKKKTFPRRVYRGK